MNKAFIKILLKYVNYVKIFSFNLEIKLPKNMSINGHTIKLVESKQLFYKSIYSLSPIKLKFLKLSIKLYLQTRFICTFKFLINTLIFFNIKPNNSFYLYFIHYYYNNQQIKNLYVLSLINKSFIKLDYTKRFIKLDLIDAYYCMKI